jgi:hypothetical protein
VTRGRKSSPDFNPNQALRLRVNLRAFFHEFVGFLCDAFGERFLFGDELLAGTAVGRIETSIPVRA